MERKRPLLGQILLEEGIITEEELQEALEIQKNTKQLLGQILISLGYCTLESIISALDLQGISIFDEKVINEI